MRAARNLLFFEAMRIFSQPRCRLWTLWIFYLGVISAVVTPVSETGAETLLQRGLLGLILSDYVPDGGLDEAEFLGSQVVEVTPGLPAERSGIREGDVILALDQELVRSTDHLQMTIARKKPGSIVEVQVVREEGILSIPVRIASWNSFLLRKPTFGIFSSVVQLEPLTPELRLRFDLPESARGLVVVDVDAQSIYQNVLREGSLILRINEKPAKELEDVIRLFRPGLNRLEILEDGVVGSLAIQGF